MLARDLGNVTYFNEQKERELLALKQQWGFADPRNTPEMKNCDICANDVFRDSWSAAGVAQRAFAPPPSMRPGVSPAPADDTEKLIQEITTRVMAALQNR